MCKNVAMPSHLRHLVLATSSPDNGTYCCQVRGGVAAAGRALSRQLAGLLSLPTSLSPHVLFVCYVCVFACECSQLAPQQFKNRARQLKADLDAAEAKHLKERNNYQRMAGNVDRNQVKMAAANNKPFPNTGAKAYLSLKVS